MRQRALHDEDGYADVLDARLQGDGDDPLPRLLEDGRDYCAEQETGVGQATSGEDDDGREHREDVGVDVDGDREHDDDDAHEERTQDLADDGSDAGPVATDEDPDGERDEDHAQRRCDAAERNDDTGVFV